LGILLGAKTSPLSTGYSMMRFLLAVMDVVLKNYVPIGNQTIVHIYESPDPKCPIQSIQSGLDEHTLEHCAEYGYWIMREKLETN
jgi:hypothetical protein